MLIDFVLQLDVAAQITNFTWIANPVEAANELIDAEILEEPAIYQSTDTMQRLEWIKDDGDTTARIKRIWTEVKVAGQSRLNL